MGGHATKKVGKHWSTLMQQARSKIAFRKISNFELSFPFLDFFFYLNMYLKLLTNILHIHSTQRTATDLLPVSIRHTYLVQGKKNNSYIIE